MDQHEVSGSPEPNQEDIQKDQNLDETCRLIEEFKPGEWHDYVLHNGLIAQWRILPMCQEDPGSGDRTMTKEEIRLPAKDGALHPDLRFGSRCVVFGNNTTGEWGTSEGKDWRYLGRFRTERNWLQNLKIGKALIIWDLDNLNWHLKQREWQFKSDGYPVVATFLTFQEKKK